jgi:hypothetical protein
MESKPLAQASIALLLILATALLLLVVVAALDPGFQRVLYIAQKRASCSETDGSHPLCLLPAEPGTGAVGKSITVYSKVGEGCGPEVEAVIMFSRNAWYRVEDAASYLRSLGYNVSVQDLSEFTIQVSLVVRVYRRVSETKLPNGTVLKGEICEEVAKKPVEHFVLILGNATSNTYFALKLQATKGLEKLVDATPVVPAPKAVRSSRNASGCALLADLLGERYGVAPTGARGSADTSGETLLELRALNKAATTISVDELGLTYDALELLSKC